MYRPALPGRRCRGGQELIDEDGRKPLLLALAAPAAAGSPVKLALYSRPAAAKDAGVSADGTGSHRLVIAGDAGAFTDPDGFAWEAAPRSASLAQPGA
jgi:hypothetical protein